MIEVDQSPEAKRIRFFVGLFILAVKTGQLGNLIEITLQAIRFGYSWQKYVEMANGTWWKKSVEVAVDKFKAEHPERFDTTISGEGAEGYRKWNEANPK